MTTCIRCKHKHHAYEPHAPGPLYDPWLDPAVNADSKHAARL